MIRTFLLAGWLLCGAVRAAELSVVIDDLGYHLGRAERVLALPRAVTLGLIPFAPATAAIAERARQSGHEVIVHQPMEAEVGDHPARGTLTRDMSPERFDAEIDAALLAVPGAIGVNNHTGSLLTQDEPAMRRLMGHLARRGLVFLDSRTSAATVAYAMAREARVPALQRDVFLDHVRDQGAMQERFAAALNISRHKGRAVIIAHPHPATLAFLDRALASLPDDVTLVTLSELVRSRPAGIARRENPASPRRSLGQ